AAEGSVLRPVDEHGSAVEETLPERSTINLVMSAGELPNVHDMSVDEAVDTLDEVGVRVDDDAGWTEYSDDVAEGHVIEVVFDTETLARGDSVGLVTSLGPELIEVPDVTEMTLREGIDALEEAGFTAKAPWYIIDDALDSLTVQSTN